MSNIEQTLSIIKPDAVERNLDNEIKEMFTNKDFKLSKIKNSDTKQKRTFISHELTFYMIMCFCLRR